MGRFNMWMANLMRGRYGMDQMQSYIVDRCIDFDRWQIYFRVYGSSTGLRLFC